MELAEYEALASEMEALNDRSPAEYRRKVDAFIRLGYLTYFGAFLGVIALLAAIVVVTIVAGLAGLLIKVFLFVGFAAIVFLRSMWIKIEPPEGREVSRDEAPELHNEIERIREAADAPRIHKVLLIEDNNAFAASRPRFLLLGQQTYVALGLPLLATMKPEEVSAIIGHELAHHSHRHVKAGVREYRLEAMWQTVLHNLYEADSVFAKPLMKFASWYSPRFSAMTTVSRRQAEFEADALAATVTSRDAVTHGLVRLRLNRALLLEPYSNDVRKAVWTRTTVPESYYTDLETAKPKALVTPVEAVRRALLEETVYEDSHPCLRERLSSIGVETDPSDPHAIGSLVERVGVVGTSAASVFLGSSRKRIFDEFDKKWAAESQEGWKELREQYEKFMARRTELEASGIEGLDEDGTLEYINLLTATTGILASREALKSAVQRFPHNAHIAYFYGFCLCQIDDESGVEWLERARALDPDSTGVVEETLAAFYESRGESHRARKHGIKAGEIQDKQRDEYVELATLSINDTWRPSNLAQSVIEGYASKAKEVDHLIAAYVLRKVSPTREDRSIEFLVLVVKPQRFKPTDDALMTAIYEHAKKVYGELEGTHLYLLFYSDPVAYLLARHSELRIFAKV
ncbi:MAG: M48 family metallopeptidase [Fimbriimonadaceae bacterium]